MRRARVPLAGVTLLLAALAGCSTVPPEGPVTPPEIYPDRTAPEPAFHTFLWAWHTGDVEVLLQVTGAWLRHDLRDRLAREDIEDPVAAAAAWYREGAEALTLREVDWQHRGEALAAVRVVLSARTMDRAELNFTLVKRPDGWAVMGEKLLR